MTNTRKMALIAILSAISFLLMFYQFPLLTNFFKLDFSILPVLLGLLMLDFGSAVTILIIRSILKLVLNNNGVETFVGLPMNIVAIIVFVLAFALLWKKEQTNARFVLATMIGTIGLTVTMVVLNYIYAVPLYAQFAGFKIAQVGGWVTYLLMIVTPFNLLEGLVWALVFWLLYLLLKPVLLKYEK